MFVEFLHPSLIVPVFLAPLPPLPPLTTPPILLSLRIFSLFFSTWTAYCSILKVPDCVLSCPLLPSMHCSTDLELCRLRMGKRFWCRGRGGGVGGGWGVEGETGRCYDTAFIYSFQCFPFAPTAVINLKSPPPPSSFCFFHAGPEIVSMRLKKTSGKKTWYWCKQSLRAGALSWCDPHSERRKQQLLAWEGGLRAHTRVCVWLCVRALWAVILLGKKYMKFQYFFHPYLQQRSDVLFYTLSTSTTQTCVSKPFTNTPTHNSTHNFFLWV